MCQRIAYALAKKNIKNQLVKVESTNQMSGTQECNVII